MRYLPIIAILDLFLLLPLAQSIGFVRVLAIILSTGIVGAAIIRWQGMRTLGMVRGELQAGRMPADSLSSDLTVLLAGGLLVWPGVLGDIAGLLLLIAPVRRLVKSWMARKFDSQITVSTLHISSPGGFNGSQGIGAARPDSADPSWVHTAGQLDSGSRPVKHVENEAIDK